MGLPMPTRIIILIGLLFTLNCQPKQAGVEKGENHTVDLPLALMIEAEITGEILGLSLKAPGGLAGGGHGSIFLCDEGNNRVIRFDAELIARADTKGYGGGEGMLSRPAYCWLDNTLNLIVADPGNQRLVWFDRQLHYVDELSLIDEEDPLKYGEVASVGVTSFGELWVVDWEMGQVAIFDNTNKFDSFVGDFGYSGGELMRPEKIVADRHDGFWICDAGNGRLVHYDGYGNFQEQLTDEMIEYPISVALTEKGKWVLDGRTGQIIYFDNDHRRQFVTGPMLVGSSQMMKKPSDILLLSNSRLLISDTGNNRLLVCRIYYD